MKKILLLLLPILFIIACDKKGEPFSQICVDNVTFHVGDTIKLNNCSKRYDTQRWLMPDSTTSTNDFVFFVPSHPGDFTFKLYVTNSKFINDFESSKTVNVQP
ncbi:MAG: PKD domain-containing protein [Chitinophagaceae bacterium]|nr:PKD domain-containing protein [Chitinophagaceae bacterium]HMN31785.1 hypothetical protein [Chitinophagaceae bacterium]